MVEECFQKHGRKCININNEVSVFLYICALWNIMISPVNIQGQWLLDGTFGCSVEYGIALLTVHASGAVGPLKHAVNSVYGPGRVCEPPVDGPLLDQVKSHIVSKVLLWYTAPRVYLLLTLRNILFSVVWILEK